MFICSLVLSYFCCDKDLVKFSSVEYISVTTFQKAFICVPKLPWRVGIHIMIPDSGSLILGGAGGQNLRHFKGIANFWFKFLKWSIFQ